MTKSKQLKRYEAKVKVLTTPFADMRVGQRMAIGTPELIRHIVKEIPRGSEWSLTELRQRLARELKAEVACPVTTAMYLRVAVESELASGRVRFGFPFWRALSPQSPLFQKLGANAKKVILARRRKEGLD